MGESTGGPTTEPPTTALPTTDLPTEHPPTAAIPPSGQTICAYEIHDPSAMPIDAAPFDRQWMDDSPQAFAYRCLPMVIANQSGWVIGCPVSFRLYWYGGNHFRDLEIRFEEYPDPRITSTFGSGVLTFSLPYLFRTPPGINLWVKGPSNWLRDGVQALEGVVETDWSASTFTMNWRMTRPFNWVEFKRGEPICMIVPVPRGLAESLVPKQVPLATNPELAREYETWSKGRTQFLHDLRALEPAAVAQGWQKDYFKGQQLSGERFAGHQTRLSLRKFEPEKPAG